MLELLGDFYRVEGVAEQPTVEPGPGGTTYYWLEVFRRAVLHPNPYPCYEVSVDVYVRDGDRIWDLVEGCSVLENAGKLHHYTCTLLYQHPYMPMEKITVEIVEYEGRTEAISLHFRLCGFHENPDYSLIERLYTDLVVLLEKRDPRSAPLWVDVREIMRYKWV